MKRAVALIALGTALVLAGVGAGGVTSAGGHGILLVGKAKHGKTRIVVWHPGSQAKPLGPVGWEKYPVWSPDGRSIAWTEVINLSDDNHPPSPPESDRISVMWPDGTHVRRFAADPRGDGTPTWSPDGRHIAYERGASSWPHGLAIIDVRSGRKRVLHPPSMPPYPYDAAWGKAGIAYSSELGVRLLNPVTGRSRLLARTGFGDDFLDRFAWSRSGVLAVVEPQQIVLVKATGRVVGKLRIPPATRPVCAIAWSPKGERILVWTVRETFDGTAGLWVATVSTKHWRRLRPPVKTPGTYGCTVSWR